MVTSANAPAGWYPDPDDPTSRRRWTGTAWEAPRPRVERSVVQAFVSMSLVGVATVVLGGFLVAPRLSGSSAGACSWDGADGTYDAWRACRRAACDELNAQVGSSAAVAWIPWLVLLVLAIIASAMWFGGVRGHSGRAHHVLAAALVPAWVAVLALFPGLLALGGVLGDCTT